MPTVRIPNPAYSEEFSDPEPQYLELVAHYEVCPTCGGHGSHSNHLGAFTQSDIDELGQEWLDDYARGYFDKTCETCQGNRVVPTVTRELNSPELLAIYDKWEQDEWEYRRESEMERRMMGDSDYFRGF